MGKSSSRKKERSKSSSSQRSRRKSRSSKKLKSKKLRYRHDSPSLSDTDFESSTSVSSSQEDDEKVRRSRSKMGKNASKKRANKRSHDRQSRDYSPHSKKRKHSKRDNHSEVKKTKKKKRRRDTSVSATSDSLSCGDGSTTGNESEIERRRGRSIRRKGNMEKTERSRFRSKSHSPCSLSSEGSDHQNEVEDGYYAENNFKRLRSVIVVVGEENKLQTFDGNDQQEDATHQLDDGHPSFGDVNCKDGMSNNRELDDVILKEVPEIETKKEVFIPDNINSVVVKDDGVENEGCYNDHGGATGDHDLFERNNDCSGNTDSINCIDLESVLRQRALENLRKFKRVPPRNVETPANCKVDNNNAAKQLHSLVSKSVHATSEAKINGNELPLQGGQNAVNFMIVEENVAKSTDAIDSAVASMHDPVYCSQNPSKIFNGSNGMNEKQDISSLNQEAVIDNICQKTDSDICSTTNKRNLVIAASSPESKVVFLLKQASAPQEPIPTKPSKSDIGVDEPTQTQTQMRNNDDQKIGNNFCSSAHKASSSSNSISGENSLNKSGHESSKGSQFEQKTMSVKRGGEMVQVNYKVYIPKRAPALTRRQLKR